MEKSQFVTLFYREIKMRDLRLHAMVIDDGVSIAEFQPQLVLEVRHGYDWHRKVMGAKLHLLREAALAVRGVETPVVIKPQPE